MKQLKLIFTLFVLFLLTFDLVSQEKTFIREYEYEASETDSKVSSRRKALKEVKVLLLEELGTYVESYVNYKVTEENEKITKDFFTNEIKTISAGITETKIIKENWDGYEYYIKAEIKADPEEVIRRINKTISARKSSKVIDSLTHLLDNSKDELELRTKKIKQLEQELVSKEETAKTKEQKLNRLRYQLNKVKTQLQEYQAKERQILSEIEEIEQEIKNSTRKAVNNVRIGMTPGEVKQVCGYPRSVDDCSGLNYNYGSAWVMFEGGIVKAVVYAADFQRCSSVKLLKMTNARFYKN